MINNKKSVVLVLPVFVSFAMVMPARASEIDELKATIQSMQQSMEQMQKRITELERENHTQKQRAAVSKPAPATATAPIETTAPASVSDQTVTIAPTAVTIQGRVSQIKDRPAMDDQQEAAPRPNDLTLDPKYRAFVPIPNTPVLIKFNAKPRVDFTDDPQILETPTVS